MKRYWLRLYPEQPLQLPDEHIIPAAALRGALASILLANCVPGHEHDTGPCGASCQYWTFFGERTTIHTTAAYAGSGDETGPFLATARTCQAVPGFKAAGGHGVFDIAIRQAVFEEMVTSAAITAGGADRSSRLMVPFVLACPVCGAGMIPCEGLLTKHGERDFVVISDISVPTTTSYASLGRPRKQIVARHSVTASMISRNIYYVAQVDVPDRLDGLFRDTVAGGLWIGGGRSRGMGAMRVELALRQALPPLEDRIARLNRALRAERRFYSAMDPASTVNDEGAWYFSLDMTEPVLASYDAAPTLGPVLATLPNVTPIRSWLTPSVVGGWHQSAGLPRRTHLGTTGVVLYRVPPDTNRATVEELLNFIESEGIGAGHERGFGSVRVCDPFHLNVDPL